MKRFVSLLPLFVLLVSSVAAADSVPVFDMTQGSVTVTPYAFHGNFGTNDVWTFANSGISISGATWVPDPCLLWAPGGSSCDPTIYVANIGWPTPNTGTVSGSNSPILFLGTVSISAPSLVMPAGSDLTTFSVTMPVLFSGSFNACAIADGGPLAGCNDGSNPVFGIFNVNGPGTANLSFFNLGTPDDPTIWHLSSGIYSFYSTPEPSGITLACFGAMGLILTLRSRLLS